MKTSSQFFSAKQFSLLFLFLFIFSGILLAQTAEIPYHSEPYSMESDFHHGSAIPGDDPINVFTSVVEFDNIPWLALQFSDFNLGENSYLIITSLHDGYWQKLDAVSIEQWNYNSAFFNGSAVEVKLYVAPLDQKIFFQISAVTVGEWNTITDSQCGPTDDRISSDQPATGRLMNIGCTAWIIPNGNFVSAGHCLDGGGGTYVEFQVPASLPGGTVQHPGPEDQYSVDLSSKVYTNGGIGNDWGTFEVFPNSITGLMPMVAQGAYWPLVQDLGPDSIRITGYGVDSGVDNQTQQTHVGPNFGSSGTTMRYRTDTQGGNSGSPVIDELTGNAVGVHTHGGCNTSGGNNSGTSLFHTAFWAAVDQGMGGCPIDPATNPDPANGATGVSINLASINWTNGAGANNVEVWFDGVMVYDGVAVSTWSIPGPLTYATTYPWKIVGKNDTCSFTGSTWSFTTAQDPLVVVDSVYVYPANIAYWTGTTNGTAFSDDSEVRCLDAEDGWMMFDVTPISDGVTITQITFWGFVNLTNWPYWSATPLPGLNPLTATAGELKTAIEANSGSGSAYIFRDEGSTYAGGWKNHVMENTAVADLQAALVQNWFAMGMDSRDNSATYYINWDGWNEANIPYLCVVYEYIVPVELTSFAASINENDVTLNWSTATETNNMGFEVQRSSDGNEFANVGFVEGNGTTTEIQNYTFTDNNLEVGVYSYRLRQIDFDGTSELSDVVETEVLAPDVFSLAQNYPNPFNPSTMISFSLAVDSKVSLTVFDVLGQEVVNLVNGNLGAGTHEIDFNASNLNSGVYFYRVNATGVDGTNFTSVKKMMLTK
jgi:hypothetical protein